eukprot:GHVR01162299.1.p1 GENE.GHVR01162299.1~~GHVR01162299.1.p1  ORF type:complete len:167 (+),score=7.46 GHVR01162299.1:931-1431(+)
MENAFLLVQEVNTRYQTHNARNAQLLVLNALDQLAIVLLAKKIIMPLKVNVLEPAQKEVSSVTENVNNVIFPVTAVIKFPLNARNVHLVILNLEQDQDVFKNADPAIIFNLYPKHAINVQRTVKFVVDQTHALDVWRTNLFLSMENVTTARILVNNAVMITSALNA